MFDKARMLNDLRKAKKELKKETIEVEAGDGAVRIVINGEQEVQEVILDADKLDFDDLERVQKHLKSAVNQAVKRSQELMAEKMKSFTGGMGLPGL